MGYSESPRRRCLVRANTGNPRPGPAPRAAAPPGWMPTRFVRGCCRPGPSSVSALVRLSIRVRPATHNVSERHPPPPLRIASSPTPGVAECLQSTCWCVAAGTCSMGRSGTVYRVSGTLGRGSRRGTPAQRATGTPGPPPRIAMAFPRSPLMNLRDPRTRRDPAVGLLIRRCCHRGCPLLRSLGGGSADASGGCGHAAWGPLGMSHLNSHPRVALVETLLLAGVTAEGSIPGGAHRGRSRCNRDASRRQGNQKRSPGRGRCSEPDSAAKRRPHRRAPLAPHASPQSLNGVATLSPRRAPSRQVGLRLRRPGPPRPVFAPVRGRASPRRPCAVASLRRLRAGRSLSRLFSPSPGRRHGRTGHCSEEKTGPAPASQNRAPGVCTPRAANLRWRDWPGRARSVCGTRHAPGCRESVAWKGSTEGVD